MFGRFSSAFTNIGSSSSSWFEVYASVSAFMMILRTVFNDLIPLKLQNFIASKLHAFFSNYQPKNQVSLQIDPLWDGSPNNLFYAAKEYLPTRISKTYTSLKIGKISNHINVLVAFDGKQPVVDEFEGIKIKWMLTQKTNNGLSEDPNMQDDLYQFSYESKPKPTGENGFVLCFDEKHRDKVMEKYIPHVLSTYEAMQANNRTLKIHSLHGSWLPSSSFNHPASFDSLALDPDLKKAIIDDLDRFLRRKKMYKKVGKPWKRGYLLHGPPGTGKSTLVAAMAKYLKFDVYDLDLSVMHSNSELTRVMRNTSNKSIIVIEDIDCNKEVLNRSRSDMFSVRCLTPSPSYINYSAKIHFSIFFFLFF